MPVLFKALLGLILAVLGTFSHARVGADRHADMEWTINGPGSASGNATRSTGANPTRTYAPAPTGADIGGRKAMPWSPNKTQAQYMGAWKELASSRNFAKSLMNPGSAAATLLGGMIMKQLVDEACVRVLGGTITSGAVWDECKFITQTYTVYWVSSSGGGTESDTMLGACQKWIQPGNYYGWVPGGYVVFNPANNFCTVYHSNGAYINGVAVQPKGTATREVQDGYQTATPQSVEDKLAAKHEAWCQSDFTAGLQAGKCTTSVKEWMDAGGTTDTGPMTVSGPTNVPGDPQTGTTTHPDGTVIVKTTTTDSAYTYDGNTVKRVPTTTTTTTTTEPGSSPVTETTTDTTSDTRTACEINPASAECAASQPSVATPVLDGTKTADDAFKDIKDFVADPTSKLPSFPTLNWAFTLPTGCTAIALPAFDPWLQAIDICPFLPMFHDLMSVIWVIGALFGAISMFWRSTFSAN